MNLYLILKRRAEGWQLALSFIGESREAAEAWARRHCREGWRVVMVPAVAFQEEGP